MPMTYNSPIFGLLEGDKAIPGNGYVPPFSVERAAELGVDAETGQPIGAASLQPPPTIEPAPDSEEENEGA